MKPEDIEALQRLGHLLGLGGPWAVVAGMAAWFFRRWQANDIFNGKQVDALLQGAKDRLTDAVQQILDWKKTAQDAIAALNELRSEARALREELAALRREMERRGWAGEQSGR